MPIDCGKTETLDPYLIPCNPSLHQLNFFMPKRGIASDSSHISADFSFSVKRDIKSLARSSELSSNFWKGYCCAQIVVVVKNKSATDRNLFICVFVVFLY